MDRRAVLRLAGVPIGLYAGGRYLTGPSVPRTVSDVTFERGDGAAGERASRDDASADGPSGGERVRFPRPEIELARDDSRVQITGAFAVGNSCDEARLARIASREGGDELVAVMEGHRPFTPLPAGCSDVLRTDEYALSFTVAALPNRITAVERTADGRTKRTTTTV